MAKLTQEVASLVHFINGLGLGIAKNYFGEIPEGFAVPSLYYPIPETINRGYSTEGYEVESVIYLKVFDKTSMDSNYLAQQIVTAIMQAGRNIPLYDVNGVDTGYEFHIYTVNSRNIETGVTQIEISYKTQTSYVEPEYPKAANFYIEGLPVPVIIDEEDEENVTEE